MEWDSRVRFMRALHTRIAIPTMIRMPAVIRITAIRTRMRGPTFGAGIGVAGTDAVTTDDPTMGAVTMAVVGITVDAASMADAAITAAVAFMEDAAMQAGAATRVAASHAALPEAAGVAAEDGKNLSQA